jgi:PTH1 family peptidyl-tRNA hydrolase
MKLIVGLGNPGEKYEKTRHNMGFLAIDKFFKQFSQSEVNWENNSKFKSEIVHLEWQKQHQKSKEKWTPEDNLEKIILVRPQTYMNNSGLSVKLVSDFYKIKGEDIWILQDDIDLPTGTLKIRFGGASAGHRGIDSIISSLGTDKFWRFRMGVGHPMRKELSIGKVRNVENYVLEGFDRGEMGKARELVKRTTKAIEEALEKGLQSAMNRFNSK